MANETLLRIPIPGRRVAFMHRPKSRGFSGFFIQPSSDPVLPGPNIFGPFGPKGRPRGMGAIRQRGSGAFYIQPTLPPVLPGPNIFAKVNPALIPGAHPPAAPCSRTLAKTHPRGMGSAQPNTDPALAASASQAYPYYGPAAPVQTITVPLDTQLVEPISYSSPVPPPETNPSLDAFNQALTNAVGSGAVNFSSDQLGTLGTAAAAASPSQLATLTSQLNAATAAAPAVSTTGIMQTISNWFSASTTLPLLGTVNNTSLVLGGGAFIAGIWALSLFAGKKRRRR